MAADPQASPDASTDDAYINDLVAAGVAAFKQATPEQVDALRRLFAPLVKAARADES